MEERSRRRGAALITGVLAVLLAVGGLFLWPGRGAPAREPSSGAPAASSLSAAGPSQYVPLTQRLTVSAGENELGDLPLIPSDEEPRITPASADDD